METIIGLLFILLPVILKLVGNKLEKAGQPEKAKAVRDFIEEHLEVEKWIEEAEDEAEQEERPVPQPVAACPKSVEIPVVKPDVKAKPVRKPLLLEEEPSKKREKIDPRKLVIYSEIMKPKF